MTGGIKAQLRRALRTPAVLARWTWRLIVLFKTSVPAAVFYSLRLVIFTALLAPAWVVLLRYYCFSRSIHRGIRYGPHRRNDMDIYLPDGEASRPSASAPGCCSRLVARLRCKRGAAAPSEPIAAPPTPACPCGAQHGRPVLLVVCGGAWMIGYKLWSLGLARTLTRRGFIVACMDYRNFPQADVGGMVADVDAAVETLCSHPLVLQHGGDPRNHLYLFGQSAGAHIGACLLVQEALREVGALRAAAAAVAATECASADAAAVAVEGEQTEVPVPAAAADGADGDRTTAQQLRQRAGRLLVDGCLSDYCCGSGCGPRPQSPSAAASPDCGSGSGAAAMPPPPGSGSLLGLGASADSSRLMTSFAAYCTRHDADHDHDDDDDDDDDCASCNGSVTDDGPAPEELDAITLAQTLAADGGILDAAERAGSPPRLSPHPSAVAADRTPRTGNRRIRRYFGVSGPYDIVGSAAYLCSRGIGWRVLSAIFGGQLERFSPTRLLQHAVASSAANVACVGPPGDASSIQSPTSENPVVATPRSARSASVGVGPAPSSVPPSPLARPTPVAASVELPPLPVSARWPAATATEATGALHLSSHLPSVDLFHGTADKTVPHAESSKLADALRSAGAPVTCTLLDGQSHTHAILEGPFGGDDRLLDAMCDRVWGDMHGGVDHRDALAHQAPLSAPVPPSCVAPAHVGTARIVPEVLLSLAARVNPF